MSSAPQFILDTNVVVSGIITPAAPPATLLDYALDGHLALVASPELINEWRTVLLRPKFGLNPGAVESLVKALARNCTLVQAILPADLRSPDPRDQFLVDLACATGAYLVSGNLRHLSIYPNAIDPRGALELIADEGRCS